MKLESKANSALDAGLVDAPTSRSMAWNDEKSVVAFHRDGKSFELWRKQGFVLQPEGAKYVAKFEIEDFFRKEALEYSETINEVMRDFPCSLVFSLLPDCVLEYFEQESVPADLLAKLKGDFARKGFKLRRKTGYAHKEMVLAAGVFVGNHFPEILKKLPATALRASEHIMTLFRDLPPTAGGTMVDKVLKGKTGYNHPLNGTWADDKSLDAKMFNVLCLSIGGYLSKHGLEDTGKTVADLEKSEDYSQIKSILTVKKKDKSALDAEIARWKGAADAAGLTPPAGKRGIDKVAIKRRLGNIVTETVFEDLELAFFKSQGLKPSSSMGSKTVEVVPASAFGRAWLGFYLGSGRWADNRNSYTSPVIRYPVVSRELGVPECGWLTYDRDKKSYSFSPSAEMQERIVSKLGR